MKRPKLFVLLAASGLAIALLVYPAALSAADGKPTRFALTDAQQAVHFPAGSACSFELDGTPVSNNQYVKIYPVDENGDVRLLFTGSPDVADDERRHGEVDHRQCLRSGHADRACGRLVRRDPPRLGHR